MKKKSVGLVLVAFLVSSNYLFSQKISTANKGVDYIQVTVLEKGVKRKINIPENDAFKNRFNTHSAKQLDSKEGIVLSFKDQTQVSVDEFESKYGIKLERKLVIGYYIFKNMSEYSDIQIVEKIIKNETNIKTVKPNWKKKNTPR